MTRLSFLLVSEHQTGVARNLSVCRRIIFYYPDDISLRITELRLVPKPGIARFGTMILPPASAIFLRQASTDSSSAVTRTPESGRSFFLCNTSMNSRFTVLSCLRSASNPSNLPIFEFPSQVHFYKTPQPVPGHPRGSRNAQHTT
jgi:hypothetical protein